MTSDRSAASTAASPNTTATLWSNIAWAWSALSPAAIISAANERRTDLEDADPDDGQRARHDDERGHEEARPDPVPGAPRRVHQPARRSTGLAAR